MCSGRPRVDFHRHKRTRLRARHITKRGLNSNQKSAHSAADSHTDAQTKIMFKAFSAPRGERDPLLTRVVNASSSGNVRQEKSALESFRKKRESSLRNKEKFTGKEEEEDQVQRRPKNDGSNNKTIHDVFAHSAVFAVSYTHLTLPTKRIV